MIVLHSILHPKSQIKQTLNAWIFICNCYIIERDRIFLDAAVDLLLQKPRLVVSEYKHQQTAQHKKHMLQKD